MSKQYNLISLFTGAGGLDIGLEMAGFETISANDLDPQACESLRKNKELIGTTKSQLDEFISSILDQRCYKNLDEEVR